MGARWSHDEDDVLGSWYGSRGFAWSGWWCNGGWLLVGRSRGSLRNRARKIGASSSRRGRRPWRHDEDAALFAVLTRLSKALGRSPLAISHHMELIARDKNWRPG